MSKIITIYYVDDLHNKDGTPEVHKMDSTETDKTITLHRSTAFYHYARRVDKGSAMAARLCLTEEAATEHYLTLRSHDVDDANSRLEKAGMRLRKAIEAFK